MKMRKFGSTCAALLLAVHLPLAAEDIDLFVNVPPDLPTNDIPNVLLMVDNTANWNTLFEKEMKVLYNTFKNLSVNADGTAKFRVGVMFAAETGGKNNNVGGGYVRAAARPMSTANKEIYANLFLALDKQKDVGNAGKSGLQMAEAYLYFSGGNPFAGNGKAKTDYLGNSASKSEWPDQTATDASRAAAKAINALPGNALGSKTGTPYNSPIPPGSCAKNFIIYISNGPNQQAAADDAKTNDLLLAAGGDTTQIPISPSGSASNPSDEWARFMAKSPYNIVTYTVDIDPQLTGQGPGWSAMLKSMASASTGEYFAVTSGDDGAQITGALTTIFSQIQSVNSVFASVSLPVSVNTEGTYLNQVFIGQFRPDAKGLPRWAGNLKQYKLAIVDGDLRQVDAGGRRAINNRTGFIDECARSFWTPDAVDAYWGFEPQGGCPDYADSDKSNFPDGNIVEKGAQAYRLRGGTASGRNLYTCVTCAPGGLLDFNATNVPSAETIPDNPPEHSRIIAWSRGSDLADENNNADKVEMRPSSHGDVVHSRPVALNFGAPGTELSEPKVVVFYGANDGVLRAVNGNREKEIGLTAAGDEMWGFVPREFFPRLKRIYENKVTFSYVGNTATDPLPEPKPYGMDGPMTAYRNADNSKTWLYAAMRRGGRAIYAFDVSDIATDPKSPTLKWKIGCPSEDNNTGCTSNFSRLGQTWSSAKPLRAAGYGSGNSPMLIMGGGYDKCEDSDPHSCASTLNPIGNRVYVLDADTGAQLAEFSTDRAVVADVFVITDSVTGLAKWAYAVDLGANVYRISGGANTPIGNTAPGSWTFTKIASLGGTGADARKFFFQPDIVEDSAGTYVLLLGSGDREKPLKNYENAYKADNYFFMLKDKPADSSWLTLEAGNCGGPRICLASLLQITSGNPDPNDLKAKKGWYLDLLPGEQVVTSAITVFGVTTFSTQQPAALVPGTCSSNLGIAKVYNIYYANAASANGTSDRWQRIAGDGLPPSPVAGIVTLDDGTQQTFVIGSSPTSPLEGRQPLRPPNVEQSKGKIYWHIQQ